MSFKQSFILEIPTCRFRAFHNGEVIPGIVPIFWDILPGDTLQWVAGGCITGKALVISHTNEEGLEIVPKNDDGTPRVPGARVTIKKLY